MQQSKYLIKKYLIKIFNKNKWRPVLVAADPTPFNNNNNNNNNHLLIIIIIIIIIITFSRLSPGNTPAIHEMKHNNNKNN